MNRFNLRFVTAMIATAVWALAGCTGGGKEYRELSDSSELEHMEEHHHHHDGGPHGGHILELGPHHGEIAFADGQIAVYILGGDAKTAVPLQEAQVVLTLQIEGSPKEIPLQAAPLEGEQGSSRYVTPAGSLPEAITDIEKVHGSVKLVHGGKETVAEISHDHDHGHGGHNH